MRSPRRVGRALRTVRLLAGLSQAEVAAEADGNDLSVLTGDVRRREIVVADNDSNSTPLLVAYDDNDRFNLRGEPTSIAVFEAVLAEALRRESPGLNLAWSNYRAGSDRPATEYSLT